MLCIVGCEIRKTIVSLVSQEYSAEGDAANLTPQFIAPDDARPRIDIAVRQVADGFPRITDIQFQPDSDEIALVCTKGGDLFAADIDAGESRKLLSLPVVTESEQGLLGAAFHPDFESNGLIYLNYTIRENDVDYSIVSEMRIDDPDNLLESDAGSERVLMKLEQPFQNHNAGQLAFGPDGMLYIGWGDGGWADDPHGNGQNGKTLLGSMLRIDVRPDSDHAYSIPVDNPFLNQPGFQPETYAYGLRNPWRYSFDPDGRLVVADVGQDSFEEISIVRAGENYGWNIREAMHCFEPETGCRTDGLTDPVYEYGRNEGQSITGGYVYTGDEVPTLADKYIFADFISGRIWAIDLPADGRTAVTTAYALGKWPLLIATFGQNDAGEIFIGDFQRGAIFQIVEP